MNMGGNSPIPAPSAPTLAPPLAPAPPPNNNTNLGPHMAAISPSTSASRMTSRDWVIPPRLKPGRKPATDTPPTKRKAQNRASQRAFRERRAARVGELEGQLEETKEEQQRREAGLRDMVTRLEADLQKFNGELQAWKLRCEASERLADFERREKEVALSELSYLRNGARTTGTDAVTLPPRRNRTNQAEQPDVNQIRPETAQDFPLTCGDCTAESRCACLEEAIATSATGCGKCTPLTHCECLEETLRTTENNLAQAKRSYSPTIESVEKRARYSIEPDTPMELDFTARFSTQPTINLIQTLPATPNPSTRITPTDSCGFCEDGTYCICAEGSIPPTQNVAPPISPGNRLPPLLNEVTPPPSDSENDNPQIKPPPLQPSIIHRAVPTTQTSIPPENSCLNGPGTCQQCLSDPKSGLFCRALAASQAQASTSMSQSSLAQSGCCGANQNLGGGCCKSAPSQTPPSLTCADTYKTLSTHTNFEQATDELNTWLGRLHATSADYLGRAPIEVEAASVMGVLKYFDRRFGRD